MQVEDHVDELEVLAPGRIHEAGVREEVEDPERSAVREALLIQLLQPATGSFSFCSSREENLLQVQWGLLASAAQASAVTVGS